MEDRMHAISIYNNKGGVGKSTLTLFMADFLASIRVADRLLRVLVIDLDAQGSSATALLGWEALNHARSSEFTIGHLALQLSPGHPPHLDPFLLSRLRSHDSHHPLPEVKVLASERESVFAFDANPLQSMTLLRHCLRPVLKKQFDVVLLDLPSNIDERHLLVINALVMSDSIVVPVEPSRISLNAMPDTLRMIRYAQEKSGEGSPTLLGLILNRTDKRSRQFRLHSKYMEEFFNKNNPPFFDNFLPNAPGLANATDDSLVYSSLKERYGSYYPHVKKVVKELFDRWQNQVSSQENRTE